MLLLLLGCGGSPEGIPETGRLDGMTEAHAQVRANATPAPSPPLEPLIWGPLVAGVAQRWAHELAARDCPQPLPHNPDRGQLGENLLWRFGEPATAAEVVQAWAREARCYDYATLTCDLATCPQGCNHYTQLVWRGTTRFGCGWAPCPGDTGEVWVCNYSPGGNIEGVPPY